MVNLKILYENLPFVQPAPFAKPCVTALPAAYAANFAHKRALPQWKPIKENSCEHDFPSCGSHWLNYFINNYTSLFMAGQDSWVRKNTGSICHGVIK
jgi:hypothetical protein